MCAVDICSGADRLSIDSGEIGSACESPYKVGVTFREKFDQCGFVKFPRVDLGGRKLVLLAPLQSPLGILDIGQRLNYHSLLIEQQDIPISEHLNHQRAESFSCVEIECENPVEAVLAHISQSAVHQVFSQQHREWRGVGRHRAVPAREVDSLAADDDEVELRRLLRIESQNHLLPVGMVRFARPRADVRLEFSDDSRHIE